MGEPSAQIQQVVSIDRGMTRGTRIFPLLSSIPFPDCISDELPEYCRGGHLFALIPSLWDRYGQARRRCNR